MKFLLSIWKGLKINNYKINHKDILNELNVVFTWKTTFTIKKQNKKQKPSKTIDAGSYYNKANRLIIIYAFGQFQTTVACISNDRIKRQKSPNFTLLLDSKILKTQIYSLTYKNTIPK